MTKLSKTMFRISVAAAALTVATQAAAQARRFDIPSEDAARAIPEFARQAGIQITAPVSQLHAVKTPAVKGTFDTRDALHQLLAGTDLEIVSDTGSTVVLRRTQTSSANPPQVESDAPAGADVLVTGSRIRGAGPTGSEVIELSRQAMVAQGYATIDDAIRSLPQQVNAGPNAYTPTFGTAGGTQLASTNHSGGTAVNLRGLGANSTLTLIDGHRVASSGPAANFYDISVIPLSAIDRVEILADGASAVYGSDAVGGVVNVLLRKDFQGAETAVDYSAADGFWRFTVDQTVGLKWHGGHIMATYQYLKQSDLLAADRPYVRQNLTPFGGTDQRSANYGAPGTLSVGGKLYALPPGDGRDLTASQLVAGTSNKDDVYPYLDLTPSKEQHSVLLIASQDLTDNIELYAQGMASFRHSQQLVSPARSVLTVPRSNAFWVSPSPTATSESVYYSYDNEFGGQRTADFQRDYGGTVGARMHLPQNWTTEISGSFAKEDLRSATTGIPNSFYLNQALASSDPATAFNPFGDGTGNSAAVIDAISGYQHYGYQAATRGGTVQADGPLFRLPGGDVRVAFGSELRHEDIRQTAELFTSTAAPIVPPTGLINRDRDIAAEFLEVNVPIIGDDNALSWLHRLALSGAVRHEDYSDVGGTTNPRVGVEADFGGGFTLRGSYGTSFSAPLLIQMAASPITGLITTVVDPKSPTGQSTVIIRSGNDPDLKPETARNWTIGATWEPPMVSGLKLEATYFNIDFTNRIASPANYTVMLQQESLYSALITRNPTVDEVNALQDDPKFGSTPVNPTTVKAILDIRSRNEAEQFIDGLDLSATLTRPAFGGKFTAMFAGTRLFNDMTAIAPGAPLVQFLDNAFYPTSWKTRSSLGWENGGVAFAAFLNWQNGYSFTTTTGTMPIHSFTTVDLSLNLDLGKVGWSVLEGTKLTAAVQNVLDADPPFLNVSGGYDAINASALGRFVSVRLTHAW